VETSANSLGRFVDDELALGMGGARVSSQFDLNEEMG
jgi:hypothetical protein